MTQPSSNQLGKRIGCNGCGPNGDSPNEKATVTQKGVNRPRELLDLGFPQLKSRHEGARRKFCQGPGVFTRLTLFKGQLLEEHYALGVRIQAVSFPPYYSICEYTQTLLASREEKIFAPKSMFMQDFAQSLEANLKS